MNHLKLKSKTIQCRVFGLGFILLDTYCIKIYYPIFYILYFIFYFIVYIYKEDP